MQAVADAEKIGHAGHPAAESPFGAEWTRVMMWIFIISDALIFTSFLAAYGFERFISPAWPNRWEIFHPQFILAMMILSIVVLLRFFGKASVNAVENAGLYWSFVDLVWVFIFTFIYLI